MPPQPGAQVSAGPQTFNASDGVELSYTDLSGGEPIVLIHGARVNSKMNWIDPGIADRLSETGRRVIMMDTRGHGLSSRPFDADAYGPPRMAQDVRELADHLGLQRFEVFGYSLGASIAVFLMLDEARVRAAVLAGFGIPTLGPLPGGEQVEAVLAASLAGDDPLAAGSGDLGAGAPAHQATEGQAFVALYRAWSERYDYDLSSVEAPVLVINGDEDPALATAEEFAAQLADARTVTVKGNHLTAVLDPALVEEALRFLEDQSARERSQTR